MKLQAEIIGGYADLMILLMPIAKNGMLPIKKLETVGYIVYAT